MHKFYFYPLCVIFYYIYFSVKFHCFFLVPKFSSLAPKIEIFFNPWIKRPIQETIQTTKVLIIASLIILKAAGCLELKLEIVLVNESMQEIRTGFIFILKGKPLSELLSRINIFPYQQSTMKHDEQRLLTDINLNRLLHFKKNR